MCCSPSYTPTQTHNQQVYSLDYARTRLANDAADSHHTRQFSGLWSVYTKTYASDGIAGLYRGFNVSVVSALR